ncbi:MAG: hypothetical protein H0W78_16860 [Planctomycetes bacterium]|nr:hypothetical protein [Planctomycetota bacterium]
MRAILILLLGVCATGAVSAATGDWSGTITVQQSMVGPTGVIGPDKAELDDYAKLIEERTARAKNDLTTASTVVARTLRADIGVYQAELERIALARGGVVPIGSMTFVIDRQRVAVLSDLPRLVVDRVANTALVMGADVPEPVALAPLPAPLVIEPSAPELPLLGLTTRRIELKAEGKKFTVLVAPSLPNPYALCLLAATAEEADSLLAVLATVPGMPMQVEHGAREVTHRWVVTGIREKVVDQAAFEP